MRPRSRLSSHPWWSIPLVAPWVIASRILAENREAELKPTTFSLSTFPIFLSFFLSCGLTKGVDERIDGGSAMWRGWRVIGLIGECAGSRSVEEIDWYREGKSGLDVRQARRMVKGGSEGRGFVRENAIGVARGMSPRPWREATVVGCHSYMKPLRDGNPSVAEPTT